MSDRLHFKFGHHQPLDYESESFDGCYSFQAVWPFFKKEELDAHAREMSRILKPGSRYACSEYLLTPYFDWSNEEHVTLHKLFLPTLAATQSMYPADVCAALERAGFRILVSAPSKSEAWPLCEQKRGLIRKGKNNSLTAGAGRRRQPVGDRQREWRTHGDRARARHHRRLRRASSHAARELGIEIALDYALQCSPDHPWVKEHPDWFHIRPDGTIKYAENPPKKYQDIYPINFWCDDREDLWNACRDVLLFWIEHGVKTFRVDNPHTKPFAFWEWVIADVQREASRRRSSSPRRSRARSG